VERYDAPCGGRLHRLALAAVGDLDPGDLVLLAHVGDRELAELGEPAPGVESEIGQPEAVSPGAFLCMDPGEDLLQLLGGERLARLLLTLRGLAHRRLEPLGGANQRKAPHLRPLVEGTDAGQMTVDGVDGVRWQRRGALGVLLDCLLHGAVRTEVRFVLGGTPHQLIVEDDDVLPRVEGNGLLPGRLLQQRQGNCNALEGVVAPAIEVLPLEALIELRWRELGARGELVHLLVRRRRDKDRSDYRLADARVGLARLHY